MRIGPPLFFFFSLFKTTKICFGSTKIEIFYREKAFHAGRKIRKNDFAPQKNFPDMPLEKICSSGVGNPFGAEYIVCVCHHTLQTLLSQWSVCLNDLSLCIWQYPWIAQNCLHFLLFSKTVPMPQKGSPCVIFGLGVGCRPWGNI